MPRLYELTDAYASLVAMLEDCETEEETMEVINQIDPVTSDITAKAEAYARIRLNLKAQAAELDAKAKIFKEEADRLFSKAKSVENNVQRLNDRLLFAMGIAGIRQLPTPLGKFYTQQTTRVDVLDAWAVPKEYAIPQEPKVDKIAIRRTFSQTGEIPNGCDIVVSDGLRFR